MATSQAVLQRRIAYLLHAVAAVADKDKDRELLDAGDATQVSGIITGSVGKAEVLYPFAGVLQIGHDATVATSSAPKAHQVLASLLADMPMATRQRALSHLPIAFAADRPLHELPRDACLTERAVLLFDLQREVEEILKELRITIPQKRRGSVRFERTTVVA